MRLYVTPEGRWAGTQADARELARQDASFAEIDVPTDKPGLLAWLNRQRVGSVAAHDANTARARDQLEPPAPPPAAIAAPNYAAWTVALEDEWEKLPLARKLHFAALAVEDARDIIKPKQGA